MTKINTNLLIKAYDGLVKKKPINEINRDIRRILIKNDCYDKYVENYVRKVVKKGKKTTDLDKLFDDSLLIGLNAIIFNKARKQESKEKDEIIDNMIKKNRWDIENKVFEDKTIRNAKIFYLASQHLDSAKDHKDYQGKIYVDKNWNLLLKSYPNVKKEVGEYIEKNHIQTFQWVTGSPVYFITRPNCRHYFKPITIDQAINESASSLIKRFKMIHTVGKENMKPIYSDSGASYTRNNIENIIKKYEERLEYHEGLYKVNPSDELKRYIDKDQLLINKWKQYLRGKK